MITEERQRVATGSGGRRPPPPRRRSDGWWRHWPGPPDRPRPVTRRTFLIGSAVAVPILVLVDGLLGGMAWLATGSLLAGLVVFGVMFTFTCAEFALVAWLSRNRQEQERRRASPP
jgi:hypothetical protein